MEINDFGELNALNKLLAKVKFQKDLDFYEFKEFANSPLIATIFEKVNQEFREEAYRLGYIQSTDKLLFKFESEIGQVIRERIDEWSESDTRILSGLDSNEFDNYLRTLICPLEADVDEFELLRKYAVGKIIQTGN